MSNIFPAQVKANPNFTEPGLIITQTQPSGCFGVLPENRPMPKLSPEDLFVYINGLNIKTKTVVAQHESNFLPAATLIGSLYSTAVYMIRTRAEWDNHQIAAAARYAVALPAAQLLAMRQGIFLQMRSMLLYGYTPGMGEGVLNAANATQVNLPPDSNGNTTVQTYDNGEMALFILNQITLLKAGMYQSNVPNRITILGPQRVLLQFVNASVVQLTSYQRPGAGTATIGQEVGEVAMTSGDVIQYRYDDTLEGKGANGADMIIITIPKIEVQKIEGINTNEFGELEPAMNAVTLMYTDMAAPRNIPSPIPDGGLTVVQEIKSSAGWTIRGQGVYLVSMQYQ